MPVAPSSRSRHTTTSMADDFDDDVVVVVDQGPVEKEMHDERNNANANANANGNANGQFEGEALKRAMAESLASAEERRMKENERENEAKVEDPLSYFGRDSAFIHRCGEETIEILFGRRAKDAREACAEFLTIEKKCRSWYTTYDDDVVEYFERIADELGELGDEDERGDLAPDRTDVVLEAFLNRLATVKKEIYAMPDKGASGAVPAIFSAKRTMEVASMNDDAVRIASQKDASNSVAPVEVCDLT